MICASFTANGSDPSWSSSPKLVSGFSTKCVVYFLTVSSEDCQAQLFIEGIAFFLKKNMVAVFSWSRHQSVVTLLHSGKGCANAGQLTSVRWRPIFWGSQ